jgi:hypothetical protein
MFGLTMEVLVQASSPFQFDQIGRSRRAWLHRQAPRLRRRPRAALPLHRKNLEALGQLPLGGECASVDPAGSSSGWIWHGGQGAYYFQMICGIYAVLGIYLITAARNPGANRSLISFTIWSSVVHASAKTSNASPRSRSVSNAVIRASSSPKVQAWRDRPACNR